MNRKKTSLTSPIPKRLLPGMIQAAHAAGKVQEKYWKQLEKIRSEGGFTPSRFKKIGIREKTNAGLVTRADIESEKICVHLLKKLRPDFGFVTEEKTIENTQPTRGQWVIDPLDGTTNFVHGFPMFCVSLAAIWDQKVVAGVIYHPILKDTYTAALGSGAQVNGKKLAVSTTAKLQEALLTTGFAYQRGTLLHAEMNAFEEISQSARAVRRPGSAALDLAYTARGVFDGFWERNLSSWDIAAGSLLVSEAGGKVTNFKGDILTIHEPSIVATNGLLHPDLLTAISADLIDD